MHSVWLLTQTFPGCFGGPACLGSLSLLVAVSASCFPSLRLSPLLGLLFRQSFVFRFLLVAAFVFCCLRSFLSLFLLAILASSFCMSCWLLCLCFLWFSFLSCFLLVSYCVCLFFLFPLLTFYACFPSCFTWHWLLCALFPFSFSSFSSLLVPRLVVASFFFSGLRSCSLFVFLFVGG